MGCVKKLFILFVVFAIICIIGYFFFKITQEEWDQRREYVRLLYKDLEFQGEILDIHGVTKTDFPNSRVYGIACLKIDTTGIQNFYIFDRHAALKIEGNIAAVPIGYIGYELRAETSILLNARYLKVNIGGNRKMIFIDDSGNSHEQQLLMRSQGIREEHLQICFE